MEQALDDPCAQPFHVFPPIPHNVLEANCGQELGCMMGGAVGGWSGKYWVDGVVIVREQIRLRGGGWKVRS